MPHPRILPPCQLPEIIQIGLVPNTPSQWPKICSQSKVSFLCGKTHFPAVSYLLTYTHTHTQTHTHTPPPAAIRVFFGEGAVL